MSRIVRPKRRNSSRLSVPPPVQSSEKRAIILCIPDEDEWRALFWGHISRLGSWLQYEREASKRAIAVARVWSEIISESISLAEDEIPECYMAKLRDAFCDALAQCLIPTLTEQHNELLAAIEALDNGNTDIIRLLERQLIERQIERGGSRRVPASAAERAGSVPFGGASAREGDTCDESEFFGIAISIVDGLTEAMIDFFEELEALSNALEMAALIAESIPSIGVDVGDALASAAKLADFIQEIAMENFLAADTQARRLKLAELMYCKGREQCSLTLPIIAEAFAESYIGEMIDWGDPLSSLASLATGELTAEQIYYITIAIGLAVFTITGDFGGGRIDRATWRYWVNRGRNNPQTPVPTCSDEDNDDNCNNPQTYQASQLHSNAVIYLSGTPVSNGIQWSGYARLHHSVPTNGTASAIRVYISSPSAVSAWYSIYDPTPAGGGVPMSLVAPGVYAINNPLPAMFGYFGFYAEAADGTSPITITRIDYCDASW